MSVVKVYVLPPTPVTLNYTVTSHLNAWVNAQPLTFIHINIYKREIIILSLNKQENLDPLGLVKEKPVLCINQVGPEMFENKLVGNPNKGFHVNLL